ncbi:hypothetical protein LINPERPRIM_LOCUS1795 [Linum perenne]
MIPPRRQEFSPRIQRLQKILGLYVLTPFFGLIILVGLIIWIIACLRERRARSADNEAAGADVAAAPGSRGRD